MHENKILIKAQVNKKDEFYTSYEVIEEEMKYHLNQFRGKTVYCNCDNPFKSNFTKFFIRNFQKLGLKRLISTSYNGCSTEPTQLSLFSLNQPTKTQLLTRH